MDTVKLTRKEKAIKYYYENKEKYKNYYLNNKERILSYQKEHNKKRRLQQNNLICEKKTKTFSNLKIEYKTVIITFD